MATVTRYVDTDVVSGTTDGLTWATAYKKLNDCSTIEGAVNYSGDDVFIYCRGTSADVTGVNISTSWSADLIQIEGDWTGAGWSTDNYRIDTSDNNGLTISSLVVTLKNIQSKGNRYGYQTSDGASTVLTENCWFEAGRYGVQSYQSGSITTSNNCIYLGLNTYAGAQFFHNANFNHCLFSVRGGAGVGFDRDGGTLVFKNCISFNNGGNDFNGSLTADYCASDDTSGTNAIDISPGVEADGWNAAFTDYSNGDYSVKDVSSVLYNSGTDLSGIVDDDITGLARPQAVIYDVGPFELEVAAAEVRRRISMF